MNRHTVHIGIINEPNDLIGEQLTVVLHTDVREASNTSNNIPGTRDMALWAQNCTVEDLFEHAHEEHKAQDLIS